MNLYTYKNKGLVSPKKLGYSLMTPCSENDRLWLSSTCEVDAAPLLTW